MLPVYLALILVAAISPSAAQCTFSGEIYSEGESIPDVCSNLVCAADGSWTFQGFDENCDTCRETEVPMGLSVSTFDDPEDPRTILAGHCRISFAQDYDISQQLQDTYDPSFGIFQETRLCNQPQVTPCVDYVIIKPENGTSELFIPHDQVTNIQLGGSNFNIQITEVPKTLSSNGEDLPFVGWIMEEGDTECAFFQDSILMTIVCPTSLEIKVQPLYHERIGGLCGYYDGNPNGDHILRDGSTILDGFSFLYTVIGIAWMTEEQGQCDTSLLFLPPAAPRHEQFVCFEEHTYTDTCETIFFGLIPIVNQAAYFYLHRVCEYTLCSDPEHYRNIVPMFMAMVQDILNTTLEITFDNVLESIPLGK